MARDINNTGHTVGTLRFAEVRYDSEGWGSVIYVDDAVIWDQAAGARRISMFTGFPVSEVRAVNASAQILGSEYLLNPSPLPVSPSELRVSPFVEDGRVSLAWGMGNGAESYTVKRAAVSGGPYATLATEVVGNSYTDLTAANGSRYYYVVSAVNAYGTSANSNETVGSPQSVPAPPAGLAATGGIEEVSLSWNASLGADYYRIDFSETSGGPYDLLDYSTGTTYENPSVVGGVTYYFVVTAINSVGESGFSNQASATPTLPPPPAAPTGLTATPGDARVALSWNESAGADYSVVKRSTSSSGPYTTVTSLVGSSYLDTGLANGTRYYYVVTAVNRGGESPASNVASAVPTAPPTPAAPTALVAAAGKKKVTLTWTQSTSSGITQNRIYRSTGSGFSLHATIQAGVSYSDTSVTPGKTYTYKVTAVSGNGVESAFSNPAPAKPK